MNEFNLKFKITDQVREQLPGLPKKVNSVTVTAVGARKNSGGHEIVDFRDPRPGRETVLSFGLVAFRETFKKGSGARAWLDSAIAASEEQKAQRQREREARMQQSAPVLQMAAVA